MGEQQGSVCCCPSVSALFCLSQSSVRLGAASIPTQGLVMQACAVGCYFLGELTSAKSPSREDALSLGTATGHRSNQLDLPGCGKLKETSVCFFTVLKIKTTTRSASLDTMSVF